MYCRSCWTNLPDGTKVCTKCAADLTAPTSGVVNPRETTSVGEGARRLKPATSIHAHDERGSGGRAGTLFIILILLLCAVGYYFYTTRYSSQRDGTYELSTSTRYGEVSLPPVSVSVLTNLDNDDVVASADFLTTDATGRDATYRTLLNKSTELINEERYEIARELLEDALFDWPDDPVITRNLSISITGLGFSALKDGDLAGAEEFFQVALSYSRDSSAIKGLANTYIRSEKYEEALELILEIRAGSESEVDAVLASIYEHLTTAAYRDGDTAMALSYVKKGLDITPANENMKVWFDKISSESEVEEGFRTKEGSHFIVKYESGENAVAGYLISLLLEEAYMTVGYNYGFYPEDSIVAVLYTKLQFQDTTRSPSWAGAIYDGRIKMPAGGVTEKTELLEGVLFHEYTHAVVHRVTKGRRAPVWLNEGFAQYVEGKRTDSREAELKAVVGANRNLSLKDLEGSFMGLNARQAHVAYLLSLSAVEHLIEEFGRSSVIWILEHISEDESVNEALKNSIYLSYDDFEESWMNSVMR